MHLDKWPSSCCIEIQALWDGWKNCIVSLHSQNFIQWFIYACVYAFCLRASEIVRERSRCKRFRFYSPRQLQHFKRKKCTHKFAKEFQSDFKHLLLEYLSIRLFSHFNLSCSNTDFLISRNKSNFFTNLGKREKSLHWRKRWRRRLRRREKKKYIFNRWSLISISTANGCRFQSCSTHCDAVTNIIHIEYILLHTRTGAHFR